MPRFAANLTMLFTEVPSLHRPELAAQAGFDGAEILFPYDHAEAEWEKALAGLPLALINTPPGHWAAGDRGFAAVPGEEERFRSGFLRAAGLATRLGAERVHVMAGVAKGPLAEQVYRENLAWAAQQAPGLRLTVEPINPDDMPGYFLNDFDQAARILEDLNLPQIGMQFDVWHAARIHGNANAVWAAHRARVSHVQIAGFPSRNEPGGGGFDLPALCAELDAVGGDVWISAEYRPARATVHGLMWLQALKARHRPIGA
ncbi:hydroxypyruvate isomerase family protein [Pseudorhodobacter sp. MZDSW-24AT]|uniref:hydroxypyruvate isomerase family protein n=1 Tax=Pseudorhodobacter sp. MZDSW-24AT TaxID=2052957 RepID=UPI000C1E4B24|nr:TIM barrel protein [Pseudorhodobacter sp. MZDSW-24AT]PJF09250.1 hydroxypyruvate isomerase [Pseudorhodobacter sp. MZDSW-24AT]